MKVFLHHNLSKDPDCVCLHQLLKELDGYQIEYEIIKEEDIYSKKTADALFCIGGDGTILYSAEFACKNSLPVIGINAGKMGFLSEFEKTEIKDAVQSFYEGTLIEDKRPMLKIDYKGKRYHALNDVFLHTYNQTLGNMAADFKVEVDGNLINNYKGDGALVTTPTGSSAYSFSLGGPLLLPDSKVFMMMQIAPHSFNQRPVIFPYSLKCKITSTGDADNVGVFVDGKLISQMRKGDYIDISSSKYSLVFLRKNNFNFIKRVSDKFLRNPD